VVDFSPGYGTAGCRAAAARAELILVDALAAEAFVQNFETQLRQGRWRRRLSRLWHPRRGAHAARPQDSRWAPANPLAWGSGDPFFD
jgi:hypothetical protein